MHVLMCVTNVSFVRGELGNLLNKSPLLGLGNIVIVEVRNKEEFHISNLTRNEDFMFSFSHISYILSTIKGHKSKQEKHKLINLKTISNEIFKDMSMCF